MLNYNNIITRWEEASSGAWELATIEDRCKYLSSIDNLNYCEEICDFILKNRSIVSELSWCLYKHSAWFYRFNIFKNSKSSAKLHFFWNDWDIIDTNIHLHWFSAYSYVLSWEVVNSRFSVNKLSDEDAYIFTPLYNEFISQFQKEDILLEDLFNKFWVVNMQVFIYFCDIYKENPSILDILTKDLYSILINMYNDISEETYLLLIALWISDFTQLSSYFIQFQVWNNYCIEKISQKKIKFLWNKKIPKWKSYSLFCDQAHKVSVQWGTRTLFITDNINRWDDDEVYNWWHFKNIPEIVDSFEDQIMPLSLEEAKETIVYNIDMTLKWLRWMG